MPKGFWLIGVLVAIASAGPIVRWVIRRIVAPSARDAAEALRRYEAQILAPNFAALERNFGVEASPPLRALYADFALLRREDVLIGVPNPVARSPECHVGYFEPLTGEASEWEVDRTLLEIANRGGRPVSRRPAGSLILLCSTWSRTSDASHRSVSP